MENKKLDNIFFIHINKCGGTSIKKIVNNHNHIIVLNNDDLINFSKTELWKKINKVTIVRNPYDRLLSLYHMLLRDGLKISISDILDIITDENIKYRINQGGLQKGTPQYIKRHGLPMTHKHYSIFNTITNEIEVTKIFKFENIINKFDKFKDYMLIEENLPHLNKSNNKNNKKLFTDNEIERINNYFHLDFINFNYYKL